MILPGRLTILLVVCGSLVFAARCKGELVKFLAEPEPGIRYRKLTFNNSAQNQNLADFPVLVLLNSSRIDYTRMQSAGQDLRFFDSDGVTPLSFEIEKWDSTATSVVWVRVPQVDVSSASDFIIMQYGNSALADGQSIASVWNTNFAGVWHLPAGSGAMKDSTQNANTATNYGAADTTGKIGAGKIFSASSSNYLEATTNSFNAHTGTVEAWAYPVTTPNPGQPMFIVAHWNGAVQNRIYLMMEYNVDPNDFAVGMGNLVAPFSDSGYDLAGSTWSYCVMTWNNGTLRSYLNGGFATSAAYTDFSQVEPIVDFGRGALGNYYWDGRLDEIRVSNSVRSDQWIAAQYKSMTDTFITYGSEYR